MGMLIALASRPIQLARFPMLRFTTSYSAEAAQAYLDAALQVGDYYMKDREQLQGRWGGRAAERLGLQGHVERAQFLALAKNLLPNQGKKEAPWTLRTNTTRKAPAYHPKTGLPVLDDRGKPVLQEVSNRRVGYDLTFAVPKSLSLYLAENGAAELERVIDRVVDRVMASVESRMETRVRKEGQRGDRVTGNLVYAAFLHRETRPIDGIPDPHWHVHVFVFNGTWDEEEKAWKAIETGNLAADRVFYETQFNALLAEELMKEGFGIRRTERHFELSSVSDELVGKFSKRTQLIEKLAKEWYTVLEAEARALEKETGMAFNDAFAVVANRRGGDWASIKAGLGAQHRESKSNGKFKSWEELVVNWRHQMTPEERASLTPQAVRAAAHQNLLAPSEAKDIAVRHLYEHVSVKRELHVAAELLRKGIGRVGVAEAERFPQNDPRFFRPTTGPLVTTHEVWADEEAMVSRAIQGMGVHEPLGKGKAWEARDARFKGGEQERALQEMLGNRDLAIYLQAPAGGGKTRLSSEAVPAIEALSGRKILTLAPSSSAVGELKARGFARSETFQTFRLSGLLQEAARDNALWVDEASFLPVRDLRWLLDYAHSHNCRLILAGDTKQHHGVERGDAVRILVQAGAIRQISLTQIHRQQVPALRSGIRDLSAGGIERTQKGFDKLNRFGAILEVADPEDRLRQIVAKRLEAIAAGQTSLIVAPTHAECREIARAVREKLRELGQLGREDAELTRLERLNLTRGQRRDAAHYRAGQVVEFHKRAKGGFGSGEQWEVLGAGEGGIRVRRGELERTLRYDQAGRFQLYQVERLNVAAGDNLRLTKSFGAFKNNELVRVAKVEGGTIALTDGRELAAERVHADQGIAVTSHASQGKTVDQVLASCPVSAFSQVNQAQFYVSMSRCRKQMWLYTDSKAALREAVCRPSERRSPCELLMGQGQSMTARIERAVQAHVRGRDHDDFSARGYEEPDLDRELITDLER
jgi:conjugative relaxase-like TrwC/TraI family protein